MKRAVLIGLVLSLLTWQTSGGMALSETLERKSPASLLERNRVDNPKLSGP